MTAPVPAAAVLAGELARAARERRGVPPVSDRFPALDLAGAYAVQLAGVASRVAAGERVAGHKVGLTSRVMREQLGVDTPDLGHVFEGDVHGDGAVLDAGALLAPRVEPEIAFVLARDLAGPGLTVADVLAATDYVMASLEVIDSRIRDWRITLVDTVADNASGAGAVLGATRLAPDALDLADIEVELDVDGTVVRGRGGDVLGHPAAAIAWLAGALSELGGEGLRAGQLVLPGSCTRALPVAAGSRVTARFAGLGTVSADFSGVR